MRISPKYIGFLFLEFASILAGCSGATVSGDTSLAPAPFEAPTREEKAARDRIVHALRGVARDESVDLWKQVDAYSALEAAVLNSDDPAVHKTALEKVLASGPGHKSQLVTGDYIPLHVRDEGKKEWWPITTSPGFGHSTKFGQFWNDLCLSDPDVALRTGELIYRLNAEVNPATFGSLVKNLIGLSKDGFRKASYEFLRSRAGTAHGFQFKTTEEILRDYPAANGKPWTAWASYEKDNEKAVGSLVKWARKEDAKLAKEKDWELAFP